MEKPTISKACNPHALSAHAQEALARDLFKVHCTIFDGVDYASFKHYILAPHADRTRIYTYHNSAGETVGYIAVHDLLVHNRGRQLRILRTEVGIERAYRGHNGALKILFREGLRAWFQNRCQNLWFMATPVHPNPYCAAARQMARMYPRAGRPTPPRIQHLMEQLSEQMQLKTFKNGLKWQRKVGWRVRNTDAERQALLASDNPDVQFYLAQNPQYFEGSGLLMLVPCHIPNALASARSLLRKSLRRYRNSRSSSARKASPSRPLSLASTNAIRSSTLR